MHKNTTYKSLPRNFETSKTIVVAVRHRRKWWSDSVSMGWPCGETVTKNMRHTERFKDIDKEIGFTEQANEWTLYLISMQKLWKCCHWRRRRCYNWWCHCIVVCRCCRCCQQRHAQTHSLCVCIHMHRMLRKLFHFSARKKKKKLRQVERNNDTQCEPNRTSHNIKSL